MGWERRRYRGNKVWIQVDEAGNLTLDERGLAQLRYKPDDERTYTVRPGEVLPLDPPPEEERGVPADAIVIHTDGASSGNPGPAGAGVVLRWRDRRRELEQYLGETTNNVAELTAVLLALEAVRRPELPVRLFTDSSYVLGVLVEGHKVKANEDLVARIRQAMQRFPDLELHKVAAHAGVPDNERADRLARAAITKNRS